MKALYRQQAKNPSPKIRENPLNPRHPRPNLNHMTQHNSKPSNNKTIKFEIKGNPDDILAKLFWEREDGILRFGTGAWSKNPTTPSQVESNPTTFVENILEAPTRYDIQVFRHESGVTIALQNYDLKRESRLIGWIPWVINRLMDSVQVSVCQQNAH